MTQVKSEESENYCNGARHRRSQPGSACEILGAMNRLFLLLLLPGVLAGCHGDASPPPDDASKPVIVTRGNGGDPETLDPALAQDIHASAVLGDLYEGLLAVAADGTTVPGAAKRYAVSEDGKVYTFDLRAEARWSNGDAVVAEDFVRALRRVAAPATAAPMAGLLAPIVNFTAVNRGELPASELGVAAPRPLTLTIRLAMPAANLPDILSLPLAAPVHATTAATAGFSDPDRFIGNGPYVLHERVVNGPIRLRKNVNYHGSDTVAVQEIVYLPIVDLQTEFAMYRSGDIDITNSVPPAEVARLRAEYPDALRIAPLLATYFLGFDLTEPPLATRALREALSMAIDRQSLVELLGRGELPAYGLLPPGVSDHQAAGYAWQNLPRAERLEEARKRYELAGYSAARPLSVTLTYDAGDVHERIALAVAEMWRRSLGVNALLDKREWKLFLATRDDRPAWDIMRYAWFGDYNGANTFLSVFNSSSPHNLPGYANARYDALLSSALAETDIAARRQINHEAEQLLLEAYPIAPLYYFVSKHFVRAGIEGYVDNVLDRHPSRYLRLTGSSINADQRQ